MAAPATETDIYSKVGELREQFLTTYKESIAHGAYYEQDVERVKSNDLYLKCFLRSFSTDGDLKEPLKMIDTVLLFRKTMKLNELSRDSFPKDFEERKVLYWFGVDNENRKILHLKVARHKKGVHVEEMKQYVAWFLEQHHKENLFGERMVLIFDCYDAGITNMDLDLVRYIISCLSTYFPGILSYILLFEMPWLLSSAWKIIRSWLTEEQKERIILVKKADMLKYIPKEQLEEHMIAL